MAKTSGGCLCGAVRLHIDGEPVRQGICHCLDCRKTHGALFSAFAIFPRAAVTCTGEPREYTGHYGRRNFCGACGSHLFALYDDNPELIEVFAGVLDEPDALPRPTYELWTVRRERWLPELGLKEYERNRE
jgi:hypothetical protein